MKKITERRETNKETKYTDNKVKVRNKIAAETLQLKPIGHFRVALNLILKARLNAKFLL